MLTINGLVHRYADAACSRDREQWASCWTDDAVWSLDTERQVHGSEAIVSLWAVEMAKYASVVQLVANGDATTEGDEGTGRWYIHEYTRRVDGTPAVLIAYYDDRYRRIGDQWLFSRRELTRLYQGPPDLSGDFPQGEAQ